MYNTEINQKAFASKLHQSTLEIVRDYKEPQFESEVKLFADLEVEIDVRPKYQAGVGEAKVALKALFEDFSCGYSAAHLRQWSERYERYFKETPPEALISQIPEVFYDLLEGKTLKEIAQTRAIYSPDVEKLSISLVPDVQKLIQGLSREFLPILKSNKLLASSRLEAFDVLAVQGLNLEQAASKLKKSKRAVQMLQQAICQAVPALKICFRQQKKSIYRDNVDGLKSLQYKDLNDVVASLVRNTTIGTIETRKNEWKNRLLARYATKAEVNSKLEALEIVFNKTMQGEAPGIIAKELEVPTSQVKNLRLAMLYGDLCDCCETIGRGVFMLLRDKTLLTREEANLITLRLMKQRDYRFIEERLVMSENGVKGLGIGLFLKLPSLEPVFECMTRLKEIEHNFKVQCFSKEESLREFVNQIGMYLNLRQSVACFPWTNESRYRRIANKNLAVLAKIKSQRELKNKPSLVFKELCDEVFHQVIRGQHLSLIGEYFALEKSDLDGICRQVFGSEVAKWLKATGEGVLNMLNQFNLLSENEQHYFEARIVRQISKGQVAKEFGQQTCNMTRYENSIFAKLPCCAFLFRIQI